MLSTIYILHPPQIPVEDLQSAVYDELPDCNLFVLSSSKRLRKEFKNIPEYSLMLIHELYRDGEYEDFDLIKEFRKIDSDVPIVVIANHSNVESVARAIKAGANDFFILGPHLKERIKILFGKLKGYFHILEKNHMLDEQNTQLRQTLEDHTSLVGQSPQIRNVIEQGRRVAPVPRPLLIIGERGTGKELVARMIHHSTGTTGGQLITVNCAAFTDSLLESEIFGHEKGAFTGANTARIGKFEQAQDGTLFLDEIGHMSLSFQTKILRVVEYGTYTRVGGIEELHSTARIIAATNCNLEEKIRKGEFLADLYDRLSFETLSVPPLRERQCDIEILARHFLNQFEREIPAFSGKTFSKSAIKALNSYSFPGNVRELKNIIERAAYRDTTNEITPEDIGLLGNHQLASSSGRFEDRVNSFITELLVNSMAKAKNNQTKAAKLLGLSYHQFRYYLKKHCP